MEKNGSKYCSLCMMILLAGATLDETRQEIKFPVVISGMGSVTILTSTSRPVTYGFMYSYAVLLNNKLTTINFADKSQIPEVSIRVEAYPDYHHNYGIEFDRTLTSYRQWRSVRT